MKMTGFMSKYYRNSKYMHIYLLFFYNNIKNECLALYAVSDIREKDKMTPPMIPATIAAIR